MLKTDVKKNILTNRKNQYNSETYTNQATEGLFVLWRGQKLNFAEKKKTSLTDQICKAFCR